MRLAFWPRLLQAIPSQCAICKAWPTQLLCPACIARFAQPIPRCPGCALALAPGLQRCGACLLKPPPLDLCLAAVDYAYPWSRLVADLKFHDQCAVARPLARLMRQSACIGATLDAADCVLPMPLANARLRQRGYNQAQLLARALAPRLWLPSVLLRVKDTPPQASLPRHQRLANLQGVFALAPHQAARVRGARVVLVDDVMTSGASLHAAARVLREGGASHLSAVVLARTA